MKKRKFQTKVENNYFSTRDYIQPIKPIVKMTLNSRDFSVKGLAAVIGLGFATHGGIQYVQHKECRRSFGVSLFFIGIYGILEAKDYWLNKKTQKKESTTSINMVTHIDDCVDEENKLQWEDMNDAVYNHTDEKLEFIPGDLAVVGGTLLIVGPKCQGKTAFITTLIDYVSKGETWSLFPDVYKSQDTYEKQDVYLYDLEMQYSQLSDRNGKHDYRFHGIKRSKKQSYTVESWLEDAKLVVAKLCQNTVIVVDNITRLDSDVTQPVTGKKLFKGIRKLQEDADEKGFKLTVILVAHTSNDYQEKNPITLKELAVADSLTTGIDTILAIGPTKNKKEHLVKVISNRNGHIPDEVAITRIIENPYLKHEFVRNDKEGDVLPQKPKATPVAGSSECASHSCKSDKYEFTNEDKKEMAKMKKEGKRLREIADYFKEEGKEISHTTVKKYINEVSA